MNTFINYIEPIITSINTATVNFGFFLAIEVGALILSIWSYLIFFFSFGFIFLALTAVGAALLTVQAEQERMFDIVEDGISELSSTWNSFAPIAQELVDCIQPILVFLNFVLEIVAAVAFVITEAINDEIPTFPVLFEWAERSNLEGALTEEEIQARANELAEEYLYDAKIRMQNMTDVEKRYFLDIVDYEITKITDVHAQNTRALPISLLCNVIDVVGQFVVDVIDLFIDFVLSFVDFVATNFFDLNTGITTDFITLFVSFIIDEVLAGIPFAQCFRNIPYSIIACLCPFVYESPVNTIINFGGNEQVPEDPIKAVIGCLCLFEIINGSVDLNDNSQTYLDLVWACFGIDEIIDIINSIVDYITNVLEPLYNVLKSLYNTLRKLVNQILDTVDELVRLVERICDDTGVCKRDDIQSIRDEVRDLMQDIRDNFSLLDADMAELTRRENIMKTVRETLYSNPAMNHIRNRTRSAKSRSALGPRSELMEMHYQYMNHTMRAFINATRDHFNDISPEERMSNLINKFRDSPKFQEFVDHSSLKYGEEGHLHAIQIVKSLRAGADAVSRVFRHGNTSVLHELRSVNISGFVSSVQTLARNVRKHEGYKESALKCKFDAKLRMIRSSIEGGDGFPRTAKYLIQKYGMSSPIVTSMLNDHISTFGAGVVGAKGVREALKLNNTYEVELELSRLRLSILRKKPVEIRDEVKRLQSAYKNGVARDPFTASVMLGASTLTAGVGVVSGVGARIIPLGLTLAIGPLTLLLTLFITPIISIITMIASGLVVRIAEGDDQAYIYQAFDFFYPFFVRFKTFVEYSFINGNGISVSDAIQVAEDFGDILPDQLNVMSILFLRSYVCIPEIWCPPLPLINRQGRGLENIFEWFNRQVSCNPEEICSVSGEGNNAPCRCPVNAFLGQEAFYRDVSNIPLQRMGTPDDPCVSLFGSPRGRRICFPMVVLGTVIPTLSTSTTLDPQCKRNFGYHIDSVVWYNSGFWGFIGANLQNVGKILLVIVRLAFRGVFVDWYIIFLAVVCIMIPCPCTSIIAAVIFIILLFLNVGSFVTQHIGTYVLNLTDYHSGLPFIGKFFARVNEMVRFDCGVDEDNPFGKPCPGEVECAVINSVGSLTFTAGWSLTIGSGILVFGVAQVFAITYLILFVLMVIPWLIFLIIYMAWWSSSAYNEGIIMETVSIASASAPIGAAFHRGGVTVAHRTPKHNKKGRKAVAVLKTIGRSLPLIINTNFYRTAMEYHPLFSMGKLRRDDEHKWFPVVDFVADHEGVPLSRSNHYHIHDTNEYLRSREHLKNE